MIESNEPNKMKLTPSKKIIDDNSPDQWSNRVLTWWSGFSLRTKLLAIATLVVSLLMTGLTFFALNSIQRDAGMNDTRYALSLIHISEPTRPY